MEQQSWFERWPWGYADGYTAGQGRLQTVAGGFDIQNMPFPTIRCPSSALPLYGAPNNNVVMASYVGIMGAADFNVPGMFVESRVRPCCTCCGAGTAGAGDPANGIVCGGGLLLLNRSEGFASCTDGTSNTMVVGESSGWAFEGVTMRNIDGSWPHGWPMGAGDGSQITGGGASADIRAFNLTCVRYPIGTRTFPLPGVAPNHGSNNPLLSEHPGGCQGVLLDGSVKFLSNDLQLNVLKSICVRDDTIPLPQF